MGSFRNSFAAQEGAGGLFMAGRVTGGTFALSNLSGPLGQQNTISGSKGATGTYTLTLNPFKGPLGGVNVITTPLTADIAVSISSGPTYTGDSLAITFKTRSIAGSPADTDANFYFQVEAF